MERLCRSLGLIPISRLLFRPRAPVRPRLVAHTLPKQYVRLKSTATSPAPPDDAIVLRDYQEECIQSVLTHVEQGHRRLGVSLATGSGKTVIFTQLIGRIPPRGKNRDRTLILVHRRELVEQAYRHCRLAYGPDKRIEIEMGNEQAGGDADITVASVRSLASRDRIHKFDPSFFKLLLVDEAHHIVAPSYRTVLDYFGLNQTSPDSPVLVGVSATLSRFDGLKLGSAIDHIVYHKDYMDMIDDKWLANAVFTTVQSQANLSSVRKDNFGDFAVGSLSKAVNTDVTNSITVRAWLANAQDRKSTLVFCVDIEHARRLTEAFREIGVDARYITGKTDKKVRDQQLENFRNREFPVLLNCGLFTEGTDIPNVDCVLLARPTRSRNLLIQMIGRGLRLYPDKKDCHIIDMVSTLDTGVISTPTLFGLHPDEVLNKESSNDLKSRAAPPPTEPEETPEPDPDSDQSNPGDDFTLAFTKYDTVYDLILDMKHERHIRSISPYSWVRVGQDRYIISDQLGWVAIEKKDSAAEHGFPDPPWKIHHVARFETPETEKKLFTRPRFVAEAEDFETAVHAADTFVASVFPERRISNSQAWRRFPATKVQIDLLNRVPLVKKKFKPTAQITKGQAADMITKIRFGGIKRFETARDARLKQAKKEADKKAQTAKLLDRATVRVGPVPR
ncbi:P-loop containing nucleoside triphosphate hydrolase protein [Aspergillus steynii IBT 23096]|uniref:P-loop containing nucleoside triphosphate hydrolase protein n=1 Tax=Aspergillus steynii IBT 23096 TaxID=1392250 RepID=A0A2I2FZK4_9EURO|nr:P-loop containing nucleoside triphosphate hydrolase protein [Aspergillus steynii IBT 23096]PLB46065.1 P-loop containing nucleoside triphosphate hydrolase protein [Aspergillus steynii IBT 23096]